MRRLLIAIALAFLWATPALAKPKVVVTPVGGDAEDKMAATVRDALEGKLAILGPEEVSRAMRKLGLSGELEEADVNRLRSKLDAAVVVQGKITRAGQKHTLKLVVWVRGKKPSEINVQYKSASEKLREVLRDALLKRVGPVSDLEEGERPKQRLTDADEDKDRDKDRDKDKTRKKKLTDADEDEDKDKDKTRKKKLADADEDKDKDKDKARKKKLADADADEDKDKARKKKLADADEDKDKDKDKDKARKKKVATADDDDGPRAKVRRRRRGDGDGDGDGVQAKPAAPLPAVRLDAGMGYAARYLTYAVAADSTNKPPKLLTPAAGLRIEAELYPLALAHRSGALAALGVYGEYAKSFGLSIDIPKMMNTSVPIDQGRFEIGALYRIAFGSASVALGVGYSSRHYIADRSKLLTAPNLLDTPDVDYSAVSPRIGLRVQAAPRVAVFGEGNAMLVMSAGQIATTDSYGAGDVFGAGAGAGVDIAIGKQIGLRVAGEYNQVNLSFKGTGKMAAQRKVSAATDRDFGVSGTLAAWF